MENVFSYLKWRGDLDFVSSPFNSVDNLIFCAISYLEFDSCLKSNEIITLKELYDRYIEVSESKNFVQKNSEKLFSFISKSKRFKNISVARYERVNEPSLEKQFGAMTFLLPTNILVVVFCGTDASVVGWKEDFNLSYLDVIPAQIEAKNYLEEIMNHSKKDVIICGHSKGGNLAMYAAIFCEDKYKDRILQVYNNDGPGLSEDVFLLKEFSLIKEKIITFLPKSSIIGCIFSNDSLIKIIDSFQFGILEHDLFSWKVEGSELVFSDTLNQSTQNLVKQVNDYLNHMPKETKKMIINLVYDLLLVFKIENIDDFLLKITDLPSFLKKYNLGIEHMDIVLKVLKLIFEIFRIL